MSDEKFCGDPKSTISMYKNIGANKRAVTKTRVKIIATLKLTDSSIFNLFTLLIVIYLRIEANAKTHAELCCIIELVYCKNLHSKIVIPFRGNKLLWLIMKKMVHDQSMAVLTSAIARKEILIRIFPNRLRENIINDSRFPIVPTTAKMSV